MSGGPLHGVRVLDRTRLLPGPVATPHLARDPDIIVESSRPGVTEQIGDLLSGGDAD